MTKDEVVACIEEIGIVPAIRVHAEADALFAAAAIFTGGIRIAEITLTSPGALGLIERIRSLDAKAVVGAGTVMDARMARESIHAGAVFVTSPGFDPAIAEVAEECRVALLPGALTPTEVTLASRTNADFIKIFPCAQVGGPAYIGALKRPFPSVRLIASGGVTQKTAGEFIRAGASALGIGDDLIPPQAIRQRNESWIHELSRRFRVIVREARAARTEARKHAGNGAGSDSGYY